MCQEPYSKLPRIGDDLIADSILLKSATSQLEHPGAIDMRKLSTNFVMPKAPGFGGYDAVFTYPKQMQESLAQAYNQKYSEEDKKAPAKADIDFSAPQGYSDHLDHFTNFFDSVRTGKPVVEDSVFGYRAAAPALACNESYFQKKIISWNPETMESGKS